MTLTTNGNTPINGLSAGKEFSLAVSGVFGGATVAAQYDAGADGFKPFATTPIVFTAAGERAELNPGVSSTIRLVVTGATGTTAIRVIPNSVRQ